MRHTLVLLALVAVLTTLLLQRSRPSPPSPLYGATLDAVAAAPPARPMDGGAAPVRALVAEQLASSDVPIRSATPAAEVGEVAPLTGTRAIVLVRVRTAEGAPIEGATLHTSSDVVFGKENQVWIVPTSETPTAVTDPLGEARVDIEALLTTVALVRAAGSAPQFVPLRASAGTVASLPTVDVTPTSVDMPRKQLYHEVREVVVVAAEEVVLDLRL